MFKFKYCSFLIAIMWTVSFCNSNNSGKTTDSSENDYILESTSKIVNTLPKPQTIFKWLNKPDVKFDAKILNPIDNANNYETNYSMALNLGVYSADLMYSTFYEYKQITLQYVSSVKLLADGLGIVNMITQSDIIKLEENVYNADSIKKISESIFLSSNKILNDNKRPEIALLVEVGAWVESMYIALKLAKQSGSMSKGVVEHLSEQRQSLKMILESLEYFSNIKQINQIYYQIQKINRIYDRIYQIDKTNKKVQINPENFMNLYITICEIRNNYTKSYFLTKDN